MIDHWTESSREDLRKVLHALTGLLAFGLAWCGPAEALTLTLALFAHNVILFPRYAGAIHRAESDAGILFYPLALVGLVFVFRDRLELVAAVWAILAFGDGAANLVGRRWPIAALPWNAAKTWGGTLAFALVGTGAAYAAWIFVGGPTVLGPGGRSPHEGALTWIAGVTLAAAVAESLATQLDDNLRVTGIAALGLGIGFAASPALDLEPALRHADRLPIALGSGVLLGAVAWAARAVSLRGYLAGVVLLALVGWLGGPAPWAAFVTFVALGSWATWFGKSSKVARGIAEARGGRRGAGHAFANTAFPVWLCVLGCVAQEPILVAGAIAAFATAAFDTVATEIGQVSTERPFRLSTWSHVEAGTPGAVTWAGTLAGLAAAGLVAGGALTSGLIPPTIMPAALLGGLVGSTVESLLAGAGAPVGHHLRNALNTAVGAGVALVYLGG